MPQSTLSHQFNATSGTTPLATNTLTAVQAAQPATSRLPRYYVTDISVFNGSAAVATAVSILDGSTVLWTGYVSTTAANQPRCVASFQTPLKGSANTALNIQCGTTNASVYWNVSGFVGNSN